MTIPPGMQREVRAGDPNAARVIADWLRDRDDVGTGLLFDVLAFELEQRLVQGRLVRHVLAVAPKPKPEQTDEKVAWDVRDFLDRHGIPAAVSFLWAGSKNPGFSVTFPHDGAAGDDTAAALTQWLKAAYPRGRFLVSTCNLPISAAGKVAGKLVGLTCPDEDSR
jgi:hypothetical protein